MENLLFESKGVAKKYKLVNTICSIILIIFGILMLFMRNMRRDTIDISTYANGNAISLIGTDRFGGGYILTDGARSALMILGVILIVLGILFFFNMFSSNKSYVKIYEDRIVGISCAGMIFFTIKKNYDITYDQIIDMQMVHNSLYGNSISIKAHGERYGIMVKENAEEAFQLIRKRINEVQHRNL